MKKVRRLMSENRFLNTSYNRRKTVARVVQSVVDVTEPVLIWEFGIKYFWIHGEPRNANLHAMIDRQCMDDVGHYTRYSCTRNDVKETIMMAFERRGLTSTSGMHMRSDNGTQFICKS